MTTSDSSPQPSKETVNKIISKGVAATSPPTEDDKSRNEEEDLLAYVKRLSELKPQAQLQHSHLERIHDLKAQTEAITRARDAAIEESRMLRGLKTDHAILRVEHRSLRSVGGIAAISLVFGSAAITVPAVRETPLFAGIAYTVVVIGGVLSIVANRLFPGKTE